MLFLKVMTSFAGLVVLALALWRYSDAMRADAAWSRLQDTAPANPRRFDPAMIANLPEPARRYFAFTIAPGTRLSHVAVIEMEGELGLGDKADPGYRPMRARQILAPPYGLVWRLNAGVVGGSDGATPETSWTRFWLLHLVPVVRVSGTRDHRRSAFGRVVSEAAFWSPASLLPSENVTWEPVDADTARATVRFSDFTQSVDITVRDDGAPAKVVIERWSDANPEKTYRLQPFGGTMSGFETFDGYRLPTRVEGGNLIDTDAYFPFFKARVRSIRFPDRPG